MNFKQIGNDYFVEHEVGTHPAAGSLTDLASFCQGLLSGNNPQATREHFFRLQENYTGFQVIQVMAYVPATTHEIAQLQAERKQDDEFELEVQRQTYLLLKKKFEKEGK